MDKIPRLRIHPCNDSPVNGAGDFVLYWMIAYRRTYWNFGLQRAVAWAKELKRPLVVLEALRCDYRWASNRLHGFIIDGMADNGRRFAAKGVLYYPYLEPERNAGKGLLVALGTSSCVVVTDDFPEFFLPNMVVAAACKLSVRLEKGDSNGLLPFRATDRVFQTAYSFRRFLQKDLPSHLLAFPQPDPLSDARLPKLPTIPEEITRRWPMASSHLMKGDASSLNRVVELP